MLVVLSIVHAVFIFLIAVPNTIARDSGFEISVIFVLTDEGRLTLQEQSHLHA